MPGTGKPLMLETYHRFFLDPWDTRITIDQLNDVRTSKFQPSKTLPHSLFFVFFRIPISPQSS